MNNLSSVTFNNASSRGASYQIPTDERVSAMLFDTSGFGDSMDSYPMFRYHFSDNQVQLIDSMETAKDMGITEGGFMNGLIYYHLSLYFSRANTPVYVMVARCADWDAVSSLQRQINGKAFQIGIWTSQYLWRRENGYLGFSSLLSKINEEAYELCGVFNKQSVTNTPANIILCANTYGAENSSDPVNYREIPFANILGYSKISIPLVQNGIAQIKTIQNKNPRKAPVSALGLIMGLLSTCGAEESIASHQSCNLNAKEQMTAPELAVGAGNTGLGDITPIWLGLLSARGYIIPTPDEKAQTFYLSSDSTLIDGDFGSIANNRIMHKCRRAIATALLPYVNRHFTLDAVTGRISVTDSAIITNAINTILNSVMFNSTGKSQVDSYRTIFSAGEMTDESTINIALEVTPVDYNSSIVENIATI